MTIVLSLFTITSSFAQKTKAQIKNVNFELVNNEIIITYDIVKHQPDEMFKIWVKVYTAQENELKAESLTGAVGENVAGGDHKKIVWNPKKDGVYLNNDIYIQVFASSTGSASSRDGDAVTADASMGKWLMYSALYPGVGNAKMRSNKVWLAVGAVSYGCMIGSLMMNSKAAASYDSYLLSQDISDRDNFYSKAESQKQLSTILFVSGVVVWAADLLIYSLMFKKSGSSNNSKQSKSVHLGYSNEAIDGYYTQRMSINVSF